MAVAVTVTVVGPATVVVVTANVCVLAPAGITTVAGTAATVGLLLVNVTVTAVRAFAVRVTVPVEAWAPDTVAGVSVTAAGAGGVTVIAPLTETLFAFAVILPLEVDATVCAAMAKVAVVAPVGTVTVAGGVAAVTVELRLTSSGVVGAVFNVKVPVAVVGPITLDGATERDKGIGPEPGFTVSVFCVGRPFAVAESVTTVETLTGWVEIVKPPVKEPAGIVMLAGMEAIGLEVVIATTVSVGAAVSRATAAVELWPPMSVVGVSVKDAGPIGRTTM